MSLRRTLERITAFQLLAVYALLIKEVKESSIERWMDWFADAAEGRLEHPRVIQLREAPRDHGDESNVWT